MPDIPGYEVLEELGRGGMGAVYLASERSTGRRVAIKVLTSIVNPEMFKRFAQEADIGQRLEHEDIIRVFGHGATDALAWIVMEYLDGFELASHLDAPSFTLEDRVRLLVRVAIALHFAHERDVIHRDIKPSNIFMTRDGGVRVLDFGIAKLADAQLTRPGVVMGTPRYVAPEQAQGKKYDRRVDVFSLGCVAYELFSGARPWTEEEPVRLLMAKIAFPPVPLREVMDPARFGLDGPALEALHAIVHRAIEADPERRYPTALDLAAAFEGFLARSTQVDASGAYEMPDLSAADAAQIEVWSDQRIGWARDGGDPPPPRRRSVWPWVLFAALSGAAGLASYLALSGGP